MELSREHPWLGLEKRPDWSIPQDDTLAAPETGSLSPPVAPEPGQDVASLRRSSSLDSHLSTVDEVVSVNEPVAHPAPTGELTIAAICAPGVPWTRRFLLVTATLVINLGLPFINGVMLGFGEIFARAFLAPWIGLAPPVPMSRWSASPADVPALTSIPPMGIRSWFTRCRDL
ncbi:hypothetical protein MNAN1_001002 [Malassezia nana]|uniref:Mitochondrial import protein 1 n=1 Tax=Malassezia nana TaxID=180528 RepID=A0AAF0EPW2_9BASI|nr:hypothetical protein MNAN1_001002 [Malassezia nana]